MSSIEFSILYFSMLRDDDNISEDIVTKIAALLRLLCWCVTIEKWP